MTSRADRWAARQPSRPLVERIRASWPSWTVALLAILLLAPFVWLDPARGITFSNAPFSDEAWNLVAARNLVLFGHPSTDEWRTWLLAAPFAAIQATAFALFGIQLAVARLVIVACVALTGALVATTLRGAVGTRQASVAGVAFVTSTLILYYGRLAFLEPLVGMFLAIGVLSVVPAARRAPLRWGVVGGVALALAVMTKGLAVTSAGAAVVAVLVLAVRAPWARRWLAGAIAAAGAMAAAWGLLLLWPNRRAVTTILTTIYPPFHFPTSLDGALAQLSAFPSADGVVALALPITILTVAGGVRLAVLLRRGGMSADPGERAATVVAGAGLVAGLLSLAITDYQPNRYVVALLPLAAILGAWAFPARLFATRLGAWAAPALVAVLVASPGVILHVGWLQSAGTEVQQIQAIALRTLPSGATVAGQYAPLVALGAPVRTVVPFETVNDGDLYAAGARYLVWIDGGPAWMQLHPAEWAARAVLGCMTWSKVPARSCLYRLPDPLQ